MKTINDISPSNVIQVITDNATNCKGAGKIIDGVHPHIFWYGCLVLTLNLLMHDIVKHRECGWINHLYKRGKQLIKFVTRIQGSITSTTLALGHSYLRLQTLDMLAITSPLGSY
jgi:hypothetical protein